MMGKLYYVLYGIPKHDSIFIGCHVNGNVGRDADSYVGVHGDMVHETLKARGI